MLPRTGKKPTPWFPVSRADLEKINDSFSGERRSSRKSVWLALCDTSNFCGKTSFTITQDRIVNTTGLSVRTVRACLQDLAAIGVLKVETKRTETGRYSPLLVTLHSDIPPRPERKPSATIADGEQQKEGSPSANDSSAHLPHNREAPKGGILNTQPAEAASGGVADAPAAPLGVEEKKKSTGFMRRSL